MCQGTEKNKWEILLGVEVKGDDDDRYGWLWYIESRYYGSQWVLI